MNKYLKISLLFMCCLFILTGCSSKKDVLTADEFKSIVEESKYEVTDSTKEFSDDKDITSVYLANGNGIQVEFYVLKDDEKAIDIFGYSKDEFVVMKESTSKEENDEGNNYNIYSLITGDEYMYVKRVGNTITSIRCPVEYYNDARDIINRLDK